MSLRLGIPLFQSEINGKHDWVAGQYFVKNCINALLTLPPHATPDIILFVLETIDPLFLKEIDAKITVVPISENVFFNHASFRQIINEQQCDVFFPLIYYPKHLFSQMATVGWVPDFQHHYYPEFFSKNILRSKDLLIKSLGNFCDAFYCSSQTVKRDFEKLYTNLSEKCFVAPFRSIIPETFLSMDSYDITKKLGIVQKYIYLPNQFWVHKNHETVFKAWKILKDQGLDYLLICTGSTHDLRAPNYFEQLQKFITDHHLQDTIKILGFIDRKTQIQLYRNAAAILQPSLFEGWNTSIEDARALGKSLIVSDITIHREQCGELAYYFEPCNPNNLAKILSEAWDVLPLGHLMDKEKTHFIKYQNEIKNFGQLLLKNFEFAIENRKKISCSPNPTFTFIILAPQHINDLKDTVDSILSQPCEDIEIFIINFNNSEAIDGWDARIKFISHHNYLDLVKNEWLIHLNSYQKLSPNSLHLLTMFIKENPNANVILHNHIHSGHSTCSSVSYSELFNIDLIECAMVLNKKTFFEFFHCEETFPIFRNYFFPHHLSFHLAENHFPILKTDFTILLNHITHENHLKILEAYAELAQLQIMKFGKISFNVINSMSKNLYFCMHAKYRGKKYQTFYRTIYFIFLWISMNVRTPMYCIKGLLFYLTVWPFKKIRHKLNSLN